jgi:diacylglycerol kinase (ATP)
MLARRIALDAESLPRGAAVAVLVNRAARSTARAPWEPLVAKILGRRVAPEFHHPDGETAMAATARACVARGADAIVVAGGDGSLNRVADAIAGLGVPLGLIPLGTANDLARELGIPAGVAGAARRVIDGTVRAIDVLEVNGRAFCTVGGLGVAADAALAANRVRRRLPLRALGSGIYPLAAAASIALRPRLARSIRVTFSDPRGIERAFEARVHALLVANQRSLGGGLALPGASANDDGVFELCAVRAGSRIALLATLARMAAGRAPASGAFAVERAVRARIECDGPAPFFGDGEELARGRAFDVRLRRQTLLVIC